MGSAIADVCGEVDGRNEGVLAGTVRDSSTGVVLVVLRDVPDNRALFRSESWPGYQAASRKRVRLMVSLRFRAVQLLRIPMK